MAYTPLSTDVDAALHRSMVERVKLSGPGDGTEALEWVDNEIVVSGLVFNSSGSAGANTSAIQAALDYAEALGSGGTGTRVVIPSRGLCYINDTLNIGSRCTLAGRGWNSKLYLANGSASAASPKPMVKAKANTNYITIEDIALYGNSTNQTDTNNASHGVDFGRGTTEGSGPPVYDGGLMCRNVLVDECQGIGFNLAGGATTVRLFGCYAYHCTAQGYYLKTDCTIDGCVSGNNSGNGFEWYAATSAYVRGCKAFGGPCGFKVGYSKAIGLVNCQAEDTSMQGFTVTSSSHITLDGCQVYRCANGTDNERSAFWIEDDGASNLPNHVILRGCTHLSADFGVNFRYGLWTRNLGIGCDFELHSEGHIVGHWRRSTGAQDCRATFDNNYRDAWQTVTYASAITPDPYKGGTIAMTFGAGNVTVNAVAEPLQGMEIRFIFTQDATGGRTTTFNSQYKTNWTPNTSANKINSIEFIYNGTNFVQTASVVNL
jgi:hypothetical protein